jgi:SP family general alpha glucoside:H+ symporter-like MFS transporter
MLQWVWPVPLAIAAAFGPESPWWLVRRGRIDDARKQLVRLAPGHYDEKKLDSQIALMVHTNEMEKAEVAGTGFADCFKGTNRRRTEIVRCFLQGARSFNLQADR